MAHRRQSSIDRFHEPSKQEHVYEDVVDDTRPLDLDGHLLACRSYPSSVHLDLCRALSLKSEQQNQHCC